MLQQISLTHRAVENMRMPLSTSRRSKRSCGTKNTAKPATSPACLNRNWEDEESGEESRRPVNTPIVTTVYIRLKALHVEGDFHLSYIPPVYSTVLYTLRSPPPHLLLCPQWKRRGDLFYTPFERLLTDGAEQAPSMPFASTKQAV